MAVRLYANGYSSTTTATLATGATSIAVASVTGLPALSGGDWIIATLESGSDIEIVKITAITSLTLTIVRQQESTTSPASFASGTTIEVRETKNSFEGMLVDLGITATAAEVSYLAGATLADPNADRIVFWDDSAGKLTYLTLGTNLSITGTTIDAASSGGLTRVNSTSTPVTCSADTEYISASGVTPLVFTLPAAPTVGQVVTITGRNSGMWTLTANTGQVINVGTVASSTAGTVVATNIFDCISVRYVATNVWAAYAMIGNLTIA